MQSARTLSPVGHKRPILGMGLVREVPLKFHSERYTSLQSEWFKHVVAIGPDVGQIMALYFHCMLEIVVLEKAFFRDAVLIPREGLKVDDLVDI